VYNFVIALSCGYMILPTVILFFIAAYSAGWLVSDKILKIQWRHQVPAFLVNLVLGMNFLALMALAAGTMKILSPAFIWILLAILSVPGIMRSKQLIGYITAYINRNRLFTVIMCLTSIYTAGSALCFPYCWDELTYHVSLPLRWIQADGVPVFMDNPYSAFPSLPHLLFRLTIEIGGIKTPRALCLAAYMIFFFSVYWIIRSYGSRFKVMLCFVVFILSPIFITMMREAYVEPFMLMNLAAAILALKGTAVMRIEKTANVFLLCGILAAGAAAVKLTGLGIAAVIFILAMTYPVTDSKKRLIYVLIPWCMGAAIFVFPFYLRPFCYTGNPFYPFLSGMFSSDPKALAVSKFHYAMGYSHFGVMDIGGFFISPALLCWFGKLFDGIIMGWQFLVFCALTGWYMIKAWKYGSALRNYGFIAAILFFYLFWFFTSQQSRFILPLYFLVMMAGTYEFCRLIHKWALVFFVMLFVFCASINLDWNDIRHYYISWRWVFGDSRGTQKYLEIGTRDKGFVRAMAAIAEKTPQQSKIMLIFERRGLYMARRYVIATPFYQERYFTPLPNDSNEVMDVLKKEKIDYILIGASGVNPDHLEEYNAIYMQFGELLARLKAANKLEDVWFDDCYGLYKVIRSD
jgi:hypothetical protein